MRFDWHLKVITISFAEIRFEEKSILKRLEIYSEIFFILPIEWSTYISVLTISSSRTSTVNCKIMFWNVHEFDWGTKCKRAMCVTNLDFFRCQFWPLYKRTSFLWGNWCSIENWLEPINEFKISVSKSLKHTVGHNLLLMFSHQNITNSFQKGWKVTQSIFIINSFLAQSKTLPNHDHDWQFLYWHFSSWMCGIEYLLLWLLKQVHCKKNTRAKIPNIYLECIIQYLRRIPKASFGVRLLMKGKIWDSIR